MGEELVADDRVVPFRIARRAVDHVDEDAGPLDVAEERVPEAGAAARALDQTGHVGDGRSALVVVAELHDAEVRLERRERVVGDLGRGRREGGKDRGLPGVREPDQADVGDQPELQPQPLLLAGLALLGVLRSLVGRRLEVGVAEAAAAATRDERRLADGDEVRQQLPGLIRIDRGAGRDVEVEVLAGRAMAPCPRSASAGRRPEVMAMTEVAQRRLAGIDAEIHRAAATAVAAVGSTAWDVRLLPEGRGPVATIAGADPDLHAVEEHRRHSRMGLPARTARDRCRQTLGERGFAPTGGRTPAD